MKTGIQKPPGGRPSKVTKPSTGAVPRPRSARRPNPTDILPNQDPELEAHHLQPDDPIPEDGTEDVDMTVDPGDGTLPEDVGAPDENGHDPSHVEEHHALEHDPSHDPTHEQVDVHVPDQDQLQDPLQEQDPDQLQDPHPDQHQHHEHDPNQHQHHELQHPDDQDYKDHEQVEVHHHHDPHDPHDPHNSHNPHDPHDPHQQQHDPSQQLDHQDPHQHDHDPNGMHATAPDFNAAAAAAAAAQQQLDVANILRSVQNPHEHPDLGGPPHVEEPVGPDSSTEILANQSGYDNVVVESALAKRLAREPGMRLAQQRRPEQSLNLGRRSNVEALFAHIAGELAPVPCKNCHKGHGPWNSCVVVDGQMCGSCANCWFNASGARCSFHETRNPQPHAGQVLSNDAMNFQMPAVPAQAMAPFNFASVPASADPVVRFTVERAMAEVRGADRKTRHMLMVEAAARQLAFQITQYEDVVQDDQQHQTAHNSVPDQSQQPQQQHQGPPGSVMDDQEAP